MQAMTLFNLKVHGCKLKTLPSLVRPVFAGRTEKQSASQREKEKKNSTAKLDIIEIGVLFVGIFVDAVLWIGYPLIWGYKSIKNWLDGKQK